MSEHGSRSAYRRCNASPLGPCAACKKAEADYQADRRERARRRKWAEIRARRRLCAAYPDVFAALVAEELKEVAA